MGKSSKRGDLYMIPVVISDNTAAAVIPPQVIEIVNRLEFYLVENERTARRYLRSLSKELPIERLGFSILNKDTLEGDLPSIMEPLLKGKDMGMMSESGMPGIADPGNIAVAFAHRHRIRVRPLAGPSSILLSLVASGLTGQHFRFHAYLPIDKNAASKAIRGLESESRKNDETQIFMETPYRNNRVFQLILETCHADTLVSIASDITGRQEFIKTQSIKEWRQQKMSLEKVPTVFLLYCN